MIKKVDIKKFWYRKGWYACIREFKWRLEEKIEEFSKEGWHITDIGMCRKFINDLNDLEEIVNKLNK